MQYIPVLRKGSIRHYPIWEVTIWPHNETLVSQTKADKDYTVVTIDVPSLCFIVSTVLGLTFVMPITKQQWGTVRSKHFFSLMCCRMFKCMFLFIMSFPFTYLVGLYVQQKKCLILFYNGLQQFIDSVVCPLCFDKVIFLNIMHSNMLAFIMNKGHGWWWLATEPRMPHSRGHQCKTANC